MRSYLQRAIEELLAIMSACIGEQKYRIRTILNVSEDPVGAKHIKIERGCTAVKGDGWGTYEGTQGDMLMATAYVKMRGQNSEYIGILPRQFLPPIFNN